MEKLKLFVGLDVHKESIDVALADAGGTDVRHYGTIDGDLLSLDKVIRRLESSYEVHVCYEAGPCGFEIFRVYSGKTSWKKDHLNWLSRINLPLPALQIVFQEHLHNIEEAHQRMDRLTEEIRIQMQTWRWAPVVNAIQALRGISLVAAAGIVSELGDLRRFDRPRELTSFVGLVPSEYSSGAHRWQGGITRTGNTHVRRLLTEAAWQYIRGPKVSPIIRQRQQDLPQPIINAAWQAQLRLCRRYRRLVARGKNPKVAAVAVARELVAYIWRISHLVVLSDRAMVTA